MSFDWIYALVGFLIMLGVLGGIGINKPRGMSVKMWCVGYLVVALGFDALVVLGLVGQLAWLNNLLIRAFCGRSHRISYSCYASHKRGRRTPNNYGLKALMLVACL